MFFVFVFLLKLMDIRRQNDNGSAFLLGLLLSVLKIVLEEQFLETEVLLNNVC